MDDDLALAVGSGDIGAVMMILFQSRDVKGRMDNRDAMGYTALHAAAIHGRRAMVKLLLEAGASMEETTADGDGGTALCLALQHRHINIVQLLLEAGADPKALPGGVLSLLLCAAKVGNLPLLRLLIADPSNKETIIVHGARLLRGATKDESGDKAGVVRLLLETGIDKHQAMDAAGETPLHCAAEFGGLEAARVLLAAGAEKDARNRKNETPLHRAVQHKSVGVVRLLLDAGADANARDKRHSSPLLGALEHGPCECSVAMARALLAAGADPSCRDREFATPLQLAATDGDVAMVRALLEAGADTEAKDANQDTVLLSAIGAWDEEVVRVLLLGGANAEARCMEGKTPLMHAAHLGNSPVVELLLLLGKGAAVDARDRHDKAALHWALTEGPEREEAAERALAPERRLEVVKLLLARGADVEALDMDDSTPLLAGVEWGGVWQVQALLEAGADLDASNDDAETPLDKAAGRGGGMRALVEAWMWKRRCPPNPPEPPKP